MDPQLAKAINELDQYETSVRELLRELDEEAILGIWAHAERLMNNRRKTASERAVGKLAMVTILRAQVSLREEEEE